MPGKRSLFLLTVVACLVPIDLHAASSSPPPATGRIVGTVLDRARHPLEGLQVALPSLQRVVFTDAKGGFAFEGVPAGPVPVLVHTMGFPKWEASVDVPAGGSVEVPIRLGPEKVFEIPEINVTPGDHAVDLKSSESQRKIGGKELRSLPVDGVTDVVALTPGMVADASGLHVRGGRANELRTLISGVPATDAATDRTARISTFAVSSVSISTGGLNAENGDALGGVVEVETREGTPTFGGDFRWDTDRFGDPAKTFDDYDRLASGFGGPLPVPSLTWFASYEGRWSDAFPAWTRSTSRHTILDFITLGNRQSRHLDGTLKLAWEPATRHKLTLERLESRSSSAAYNHMWSRRGFVQVAYDTLRGEDGSTRLLRRYGRWSATREDATFQPVNMADHVPTLDERYRQHTAVWRWIPDTMSVCATRLSLVDFDSRLAVSGKQPWDYDTQAPFYWDGNTGAGSENNPYFATHGDFPTYAVRRSSTWIAKSDYSTRRWKASSAKTGAELRYNTVRNLALTQPNGQVDGLPGATRSDYLNHNPEGGAYVQDRWEYEGMVLNAGLRADFFSPGDQVALADLPSGKRVKHQLSPRLGIAYPISDRDALSLFYGWTFQTPARGFVFENRGLRSSVITQGNPDLEPMTNVSYQAALQHLFSRDVSSTVTVFFRDIYGLLTTRQRRDELGNLVAYWANGDYASSRGFEASIVRSLSHRVSAEANYTFSLASGVASDPSQALQFFNGGRLYLPISERPLDWDQRHTLNLRVSVRDSSRGGCQVLWEYGSGTPFTPAYRNNRRPDPVADNSRRLPATSRLSIDADQEFRIWGQDVRLFVVARNVLDAKNLAAVSANAEAGVNPLINQSGDEYAIYYTETGRLGGAYLVDVDGDHVLDWVPVHDPRALEEGRQVRMGVAMSF